MATTTDRKQKTRKSPTDYQAKTKSQITAWVEKDVRRDLNKIMEHADVNTHAEAIALAFKIAVKYLVDQGKIPK